MEDMNSSSLYKIKIDYEKSKYCYIYDKNTNKKYLDFFGQYSSLVLGYNHDIFSDNFNKEILRIAPNKITNCETLSDEAQEFDKTFKNFACKDFQHVYYCCTGALAVESAIKTAIDYKQIDNPQIISFKGSFHGINSFSSFITDRFVPVNKRLDGIPKKFNNLTNNPIDNPIITYDNNFNNNLEVDNIIEQIKVNIENSNVVCILIEPIQCTFGDRYFSNYFFKQIRSICDQFDIPLIFDEIQTGFGATGKLWYYEHLDIIPDILIFGKRTQLSGIMVQGKYGKIFENPIRLQVTWNSTVLDMTRCKYVIKAFNKYNILDNVNNMSNILYKELLKCKNIKNIRNCGLLFAFDLENKNYRDIFYKKLLEFGLLCNPTREKTIRFRPPLSLNIKELNEAIKIIFETDNYLIQRVS